ncbi:MAG: HNH endonuclease [Sphaerotilus natans subsp. sulfidivorans]|uniref:HNH endonuclease n=1 Tax=Sphaerotilus sulfidivorans TaxID=639200 RepID=UPI0023573FE2|nr:HNH endonuclease signature motif containing protein [Sphaerotilus sulfidivorans]MCK6404287.1 HNH endonuclease [Sphaerotilus sulfidivorans]
MRPVDRGACPQDEQGQDIRFTAYPQARRELIRRLGEYCVYCEMHLDASLAVEHVRPKKPPGATDVLPERALAWDNFLLACTNCNATKGDTDVVLDDYLWPDRDDTFHALQYRVGGQVDSAAGPDKIRADRLIELLGLRRMADTPEATDRRWLNRREAWDMAERARQRLLACPQDACELMREQIVETVKAKGFWSVWMSVFRDDPDMTARLIAAYPGTRWSVPASP